jgi:branched-subunit amino acid permease
MENQTKKRIKNGVFIGISFAIGTAGFDYVNRENFDVYKFIFNFLFFGIAMAFIFRNTFKKEIKKK